MPEHKSLTEALVAFQKDAPTLTKDSTNPHFKSKFVSLDAIVETIRPLLAEHGLAWSALPCFGPNGQPALRYTLTHAASKEVMEETMPLLLQKQDPQGQGSAITYARRYSLSAVLNLVADEDDDGNNGSLRSVQQPSTFKGGVTIDRTPAEPLVTRTDIEHLRTAAKGLRVQQIKLVLAAQGLTAPYDGGPADIFNYVPQAKAATLSAALAGADRD